jgi:predicted transglutaminase-like cysteine proteinase
MALTFKQIEDINHKVNRYPFESETKENWERISIKGAGDCDSYAMEKYMLMREAGYPVEDMCIASCHVETGEYHAVLLVRHYGVLYVCDNRSKWVLSIKVVQRSGYDFDYIPEYMT